MSVEGLDGFQASSDGFNTLQDNDVETYKKLADMIASLLAIAIVSEEKKDLLYKATELYENILARLREDIRPEANKILSGPFVDILELVECLGPDAIYDILAFSIETLTGQETESPLDRLYVFADCIGWSSDPEHLPTSYTASAVITSLAAAINKALVKTIN